MKKKRAVLYPFSECSLAAALWFDKLSAEYELSALVALPGQSLSGKDAGYADNRGKPELLLVEILTRLFKTPMHCLCRMEN